MHKINPGSIARILTILTICFVALWGMYIVAIPVKPFWLDEWYIIHNIKFRTAQELWGKLEFMQQFPRVYLHIVQYVAEAANFSYSSLRLTSFIVHILALIFCYNLSARIYPPRSLYRFLWVALYLSSATALEYFVQVKQYTMDMLLGLVAIWQVLELTNIPKKEKATGKYALLCASMFVAPFFSYTYPILAAPVYAVVLLQWLRRNEPVNTKTKILQAMPLILCLLSIAIFYSIDVKQVLQDKGMQNYWQEYMMTGQTTVQQFLGNVYKLFLNMAAGDLFGNITGVLGIAGLLILSWLGIKGKTAYDTLYSVLVVWVVIICYAAGKLPLGTHRLNAFAVPAIATIITGILQCAETAIPKMKIPAMVIAGILFLALAGNVYGSLINNVNNNEHTVKLNIYNKTEAAIKQAIETNTTILVTPGIAYPYSIEIQGDWVLKTHPSYKKGSVPVYAIPDISNANGFMLEKHLDKAIVFTGDSIALINN